MKSIRIFWCVIIPITVFIWGCPKNCLDATYSFSATVRITPDKDSIRIGDTIFLISSFPTQIKDQLTGQTIDYAGLKNNIGATLGINEFIQDQEFGRGAVSDFEYFNLKGQIYNSTDIARPDAVQQIRYEESDGLYQYKLGLVAKKQGVYSLNLGNGLGISKKCTRGQLNVSIENTNQHFYFPLLFFSNYQTSALEKQHSYYFKVY